ncbi:TRAP ABC transporter substrate-binding protein [Pseudolabrys sp. Root1462]|uniref:TAXI family TRAP transporter solute-binding subunit n=1 Tax=Pseudolabrys sp. Root1462 TaxID=1736466 RepID=UPI00070297A7|nr:TAXI family TRAP transporter solute-binding subunit [Pseudolabrys sp. Root1462]KQY99508.1 TRAP ABC transporter substrate-binding protein [Pseudolabrys sp. Root1462]
MKKLVGAIAFATALGVAGAAIAADTIRIGSMPVGSGWYVAAAALEQALKPEMGGTPVEIIARGGGVANPMVVEQGKAEIAMSNVATSVWAMNGEELYNGKKATHIRSLVGGLNPVYMAMIVKNDFIKKSGLDTMDKIFTSGKPLRIVMKPQGSNVPPTVDMILAAYGLDRAKIKAQGGEIIQVNPEQTPDIMREGRADILLDTVLKGHPMITEVALTADVTFMDLSEKARKKLADNGLKPAQYPEWFKGQKGPIWGADFGTHLIARDDLPDDIAYKIVKTFIEKRADLVKAYPAFNAFDPKAAAKPENNGIPLHPGAAKYYKEHGMM